jgi:hypothetical protein
MSARITSSSPEMIRRVLATWQASLPHMIDQERSIDAAFVLIQDPNTQWYMLPQDSFLILRRTIPGESASVQIITRSGDLIVDPAKTRDVLREAMKEYQLIRLSAVIPSSLPWRDYKLLGFKHEGRVRKALRYNGEWSDAEIMGALETEIGIPRRRRRKRARKGSPDYSAEAQSREATTKDQRGKEEIDATR